MFRYKLCKLPRCCECDLVLSKSNCSLKHSKSENRRPYSSHCKECCNKRKKKAYSKGRGVAQQLLANAKMRAERYNVPFSLSLSDIKIPEFCPALGVKLEPGGDTDNSPSLDRIVPELGYVPDNIAVISQRANRIKSDANADELRRVSDWLHSVSNYK